MDENKTERREYFRIDDLAKFSLKKISDKDTLETLSKKNVTFLLGSSIATLDLDHQTVISKIKRTDPDIALYLDVINHKINLISNYILENDSEISRQTETNINLSASGIAVETEDKFTQNDLVEIKLALLPELIGILCIGRIKRVENRSSTTIVHIDFTDISDADQEIIIKHNMTKQLEQARAKNNDYL